jgi:competence ComEA-like helix-hairpin-helix protein
MPTSDDRRAAIVLLVLAAAGLSVRIVTDRTAPPGAVAYRAHSESGPTVDSLAVRAAALARPLAAGERVDVDAAGADELVRLPRIGPGLAARIVADREAHGGFGSLEAVRRVPGVGAATLAAIRPFATFSAPAQAARPEAGSVRVRVNTASAAELMTLPGIGPRLAAAIIADRRRHGPFRRVSDLERVPGLGPVLVRRLEGRILVP